MHFLAVPSSCDAVRPHSKQVLTLPALSESLSLSRDGTSSLISLQPPGGSAGTPHSGRLKHDVRTGVGTWSLTCGVSDLCPRTRPVVPPSSSTKHGFEDKVIRREEGGRGASHQAGGPLSGGRCRAQPLPPRPTHPVSSWASPVHRARATGQSDLHPWPAAACACPWADVHAPSPGTVAAAHPGPAAPAQLPR